MNKVLSISEKNRIVFHLYYCEDMSIEEIQDGVVEIVKYLCEPDPGHRGHPKVVGEKCKVSHYDLVRTIAHLDLLSKKAELALLK